MRRFFRPADLAALIALALVAAPLTNRLAAQDLQQTSADSAAVTAATVAPNASTPAIDLRAIHSTAQVSGSVSRAPISASASATGARAAVHHRENVGPLSVNAAPNLNLGQSKALMIVGGAAVVTGAIIGGDGGTLVMVAGAVTGLYGLYQYLQ